VEHYRIRHFRMGPMRSGGRGAPIRGLRIQITILSVQSRWGKRRSRLLILGLPPLTLAFLLFGCGSNASPSSGATAKASTSSSTTASTASRSMALSGPVLGPDGLGVVDVGTTQAGAVATVVRYLGSPTKTTLGVCKNTTEVQWKDLSLEFTSGTLTGYRYLRNGLPVVGTSEHSTGSGHPLLKTSAGATLGMTLSQVRSLYPPEDFSYEQGGAIVVPGTPIGNRLFLGFFASDPSTPLSEIKGGSPCGDF